MTTALSAKGSLDHPLHNHALTLRELTKDCQVECHFCKRRFHGRVYCCEDCDFVLHEACARIEFPPQLQEHPAHPQHHPLTLVRGQRYYRCSDCGYILDALTAVATRLPPDDVEEDTIRYFAHEEHPLSSFYVETTLSVQCGSCEQPISGQVYGCRACLFLLHETCARLAAETQHPLHRQHPLTLLHVSTQDMCICGVCVTFMESGAAYCCEECGFVLHVGCAASTMPPRTDKKEDREQAEEEDASSSSSAIKHHSHPHPLTALHVSAQVQSGMRCRICRLNISGGEVFACSYCFFFLHKSCAEELPKEIQHFLHPQHPRLILRLVYLDDSSGDSALNFKCDSCSENCFKMAFSCKDCEFNLDPACALQTLSAVEDGAAPCISHFAHEHSLTLVFWKSTITHTCIACKQSIDGVAYCCITCKHFWLHRTCAELPLKLEHAFHPQHPLVLSEAPAQYFFCNACHGKFQCLAYYGREKYEGLAFCCDKCEFYMDMGCARMNQTLKHPCHEHHLVYCERNTKEQQLQCNCCGKSCRYDFYCCMPCNFSLHHDCLSLPPIIDHRSHWHPLELCDKFVDGNPDDLYCDYCETIRNPDHGVYRCEECNFTAHIECMISDHKVSPTNEKFFFSLV